MIAGLTLDNNEETIALRYYATIQAIAYGTRHIIEEMNRSGYSIQRILACGGGTKNTLWIQEHADISGCEIAWCPRNLKQCCLDRLSSAQWVRESTALSSKLPPRCHDRGSHTNLTGLRPIFMRVSITYSTGCMTAGNNFNIT